jgi:hypothetical protein
MQQERTPPWQRGDLVEYLPDGTEWTVDAYWAGSQYKQPEVTVGHDSAEEGPGYRQVLATVMSVHPDKVRLIVPVMERPIFPGDGWSHLVLEEGS